MDDSMDVNIDPELMKHFLKDLNLKKLEQIQCDDIDDLLPDSEEFDENCEDASDMDSLDSSDSSELVAKVPSISDFEARTTVAYVILPLKPRDFKYATLYDSNQQEILQSEVKIEADKGFHYLPDFEAYVCQKKNQFQISAQVLVKKQPKYLKADNQAFLEINHYKLKLYGIKYEFQSEIIDIKQSGPDRKHYEYQPEILKTLEPMQPNRLTAKRLHFGLTTENNKMINNKPNANQRYFLLVIELVAVASNGLEFTIYSVESDKIIVRATNLENRKLS